MGTDKMMLALEEDGEPIGECSVDEFCAANSETFTDVDMGDLAHMNVGDKLRFGGGACPTFDVTRVA